MAKCNQIVKPIQVQSVERSCFRYLFKGSFVGRFEGLQNDLHQLFFRWTSKLLTIGSNLVCIFIVILGSWSIGHFLFSSTFSNNHQASSLGAHCRRLCHPSCRWNTAKSVSLSLSLSRLRVPRWTHWTPSACLGTFWSMGSLRTGLQYHRFSHSNEVRNRLALSLFPSQPRVSSHLPDRLSPCRWLESPASFTLKLFHHHCHYNRTATPTGYATSPLRTLDRGLLEASPSSNLSHPDSIFSTLSSLKSPFWGWGVLSHSIWKTWWVHFCITFIFCLHHNYKIFRVLRCLCTFFLPDFTRAVRGRIFETLISKHLIMGENPHPLIW